MKDLHCHALYGIDDGCETIEEAVYLLKKMSAAGVTDVVLTPHYIDGSNYSCNNRQKKTLLTKLKKKLSEENIKIELYLGNEVMFTNDVLGLLDDKSIYPMNGSKYILFEFPMHNSYKSSGETISELLSKGYTPILAHPERYRNFQEYPDLAEEYLRMGVLLQCNISSLFGKNGHAAKKLAKYYVKKGWYSFLGSDAHHEFNYDISKLEKKIKKLNKDEDYVHGLFEGNFESVMNNEDLGMIR